MVSTRYIGRTARLSPHQYTDPSRVSLDEVVGLWAEQAESIIGWSVLPSLVCARNFEEVAEAAGLYTDRGKLAALKTLLRDRAKAALDATRRGPRKMDWAAAKEAPAAELDTAADRQEAMSRFKSARMALGCDPTVFFASLQQSLDLALPALDGASRHQLLSDQFVEGVQPALGAQLRLTRATGQLNVERLVHLARELAEATLATFQSQENRQDSTVEDLKNKLDQPTEQLAAVTTESRRHARTSRCYKCGMPGRWRKQCPCTRPLVHNKILEYSSFPGLGDKSVQHTFLISPDVEQTILGADFLKSTDSVIDLKHGKLVTSYGAVKLEGYPSTAASNLHVRKLPSCNVPSVQSVVKEYSELFTGDEDPFGFCPWNENETPLSSKSSDWVWRSWYRPRNVVVGFADKPKFAADRALSSSKRGQGTGVCRSTDQSHPVLWYALCTHTVKCHTFGYTVTKNASYNPGERTGNRVAYLKNCISSNFSVANEISALICKARVAFANLKHLEHQSGVSMNVKERVQEVAVRAVLFHGCETWSAREAELKHSQVFENRCLRIIARVARCRRIRKDRNRRSLTVYRRKNCLPIGPNLASFRLCSCIGDGKFGLIVDTTPYIHAFTSPAHRVLQGTSSLRRVRQVWGERASVIDCGVTSEDRCGIARS
ncbi:hypothetical protein CLF_103966 [Clonorchis sinensis]|uniref:CCHC-type domain-containing protein n=1 Tax=Clonorchis sinensis TaxID=79923 RepID=G7YNN5_CLOSI|nr:hypothetical protein CLF_103966 [Clonorchis sinensis]